MADLPKISILFLTYKRTVEALTTINATCKNIVYPKELISFYVADDGSPKEHMDAIIETIKNNGVSLLGFHNERIRDFGNESTYHSGIGWNKGLMACHVNSAIVMIEEDDWELRQPLDIRPYVRLLEEREDIGIVRLGHLAVGSTVEIVGYDGIHYLEYMRGRQYCYSGNPYLRHRRFSEDYGMFAENLNPGEMELAMDAAFQAKTDSCKIWRPADIPGWGVFGHIGTEKTWS